MNNIMNVIKENPVTKHTISAIAGLGAFVGAELILDGKLHVSDKSMESFTKTVINVCSDNKDKIIDTTVNE